MARNGGQYCELDCDWFEDPRNLAMNSTDASYLYLFLWALAVSEKREFLPPWWSPNHIATRVGWPIENVRSALRAMCDQRLAAVLYQGGGTEMSGVERVYIFYVRKRHKRLRSWHVDDDKMGLEALGVGYELTETEHDGYLTYNVYQGVGTLYQGVGQREEERRGEESRVPGGS